MQTILRRFCFRTTRAAKYRIQLIACISCVSFLAIFLVVHRRQTDDQLQEEFVHSDRSADSPVARQFPIGASTTTSDSNNCAYKNCPDLSPDEINVHIICHTHLDPGWLNTVDGYFFGVQHQRSANVNGKSYQSKTTSVLTIFNNVIAALLENARRRFVMVEMSFISRWWHRLDDDYKKIIRKLMADGRIDLAGGSWTSNDEAVGHYAAMIDQCTLGFRFIKEELRTCSQPAVAWQLDLFGHGRELNSLFAQMGYDGILFGRLDYQEKEERMKKKTLQMIWKVNENAPTNEQWLFTGILPNLYHPPETLFLRPETAGLLLKPGDADIMAESASDYSKRLLEELKKQQGRYGSNNIAVIYGGDFEYEEATRYFQNIDAMIDTINNLQNKSVDRIKYNVHYSTPTCFIHALSKEKRAWPIREGDFMSYAHRAHAFWTGFYTSRPGIKFYERSLSSLYQSLRQLSIYADKVDFHTLFQLAEIMGLLQHHDTITGTSPSNSIEDSLQRMHRAEMLGQTLAQSLYGRLLTTKVPAINIPPIIFCRLNESYCPPLEKLEKFSAIVYNPSSISNDVWLRIPIHEQQTIELDMSKVRQFSIDAQQIGIFELSPIFQAIPIGFKRNQLHELIVRVNVPPLSIQTIPFTTSKEKPAGEKSQPMQSECSIENQNYILSADNQGILVTLKLKTRNKQVEFKQNFGFYTSSPPDGQSDQASGLYVFRPAGGKPATLVSIKSFYCLKHPGYQEIVQVYSEYGSQSIRLVDNSPYIEFDWVVGRLNPNVEFVTSYQIKELHNGDVFYTDSNGRSLMKRIRDKRDGYTFTQSEKNAGNYYPLVTGILIKDEKEDLQMSVVTDRAQGGGSTQDGLVEIMLHRRVASDDGLGVSETLNEMGIDNQGLVIRGRHLVMVTKCEDGMRLFREHAMKSVWKPIVSFLNDDSITLDYTTWSMLKQKLPPQAHVLTIEPLSQDKDVLRVLFRIENIYDVNEHSTLSKSISINILKIFPNHKILEAKEVTLAANMYKDEAFERLKWNINSTVSDNEKIHASNFDGQTIHLRPMEIRSFIVKLIKR